MSATPSNEGRPLGLRLIIGYKVVKAPVMAALALWLTFARSGVSDFVADLARHLAEGGWLLHRMGEWLGVHVNDSVVKGGAIVAWLDTVSTTAEATLLLLGKPWGEWLVVVGLGALIPAEIVWLTRHLTIERVAVLAVNGLVFGYLVWRRLRARKAERTAASLGPEGHPVRHL